MSSNKKYLLPLDEEDEEELMDLGDLWRPCPNYPGYDASWNGWVRSWIQPNHTVHGFYYEITRVNPLVNGVRVNRHRGQLVADAFLIQPEPEWQLGYLDGDKTNFAVKNLTWETRVSRLERAQATKRLHQHKSHCRWGHEKTESNVSVKDEVSWMCLICARAHASRYGEIRTLKSKGLPYDHVTFEYVLKRKGVWIAPEDRPKPQFNKLRNQRLLEGRLKRESEIDTNKTA